MSDVSTGCRCLAAGRNDSKGPILEGLQRSPVSGFCLQANNQLTLQSNNIEEVIPITEGGFSVENCAATLGSVYRRAGKGQARLRLADGIVQCCFSTGIFVSFVQSCYQPSRLGTGKENPEHNRARESPALFDIDHSCRALPYCANRAMPLRFSGQAWNRHWRLLGLRS